ncbi:hypothetical protein [Celeribacter sp.]|uniref:hypothetical protein n=1 Tax=Celeribacter sp. TaxID=1890673 RepID=UPI003A8F4EF6
MYKMVLQAVLFSAGALYFIFNYSDGLRSASRSGNIAALTSGSVASKYADIDMTGPDPIYQETLFEKYDPRKLWRDRPKTVRLNTKTIKVAPSTANEEAMALSKHLAKDGISPDKVSVVKLD